MHTGRMCNGKIPWQSPKLVRNIISSLVGIENRIHVSTYGFIVKNFYLYIMTKLLTFYHTNKCLEGEILICH